MDFKDNKPIYLQIVERVCDEILLDKYPENERIPSVREYASIVEVNLNTVMRSFEHLQSADIIFNKRGIGYFVSEGAKEKILSLRKEQFLQSDMEEFFRQVYLLSIPFKEIQEMFDQYVKQQEKQ